MSLYLNILLFLVIVIRISGLFLGCDLSISDDDLF